jgi:hypothetical protein
MLGPSSATEEGNLGANPAKRVRLRSISKHSCGIGWPASTGKQPRQSLIMVAATIFDAADPRYKIFGLLELARTIIIPAYSKPRADVHLDSQRARSRVHCILAF